VLQARGLDVRKVVVAIIVAAALLFWAGVWRVLTKISDAEQAKVEAVLAIVAECEDEQELIERFGPPVRVLNKGETPPEGSEQRPIDGRVLHFNVSRMAGTFGMLGVYVYVSDDGRVQHYYYRQE
jgi:hypothetical protein